MVNNFYFTKNIFGFKKPPPPPKKWKEYAAGTVQNLSQLKGRDHSGDLDVDGGYY
jgi:hypothetical protein